MVFGRHIASTIASFALGSFFCLLCSGCLEHFEEKHGTYESARAAGMVTRGWLPVFLPDSIFDIKEKHNIDTNESILSFRLDDAGIAAVENACRQIETRKLILSNLSAPWWPRSFIGLVDAGNVYTCSEKGTFLVLDLKTQRAYYWRLG